MALIASSIGAIQPTQMRLTATSLAAYVYKLVQLSQQPYIQLSSDVEGDIKIYY